MKHTFQKTLISILLIILSIFSAYAIEFGFYGYNEYSFGDYSDISFTTVGGGLSLDGQPVKGSGFGLGLRLQGNYTLEKNDAIENHWNAAALGSLWWRFYTNSSFMFKPSIEYGLWTHSMKNLQENKTALTFDQALQFGLGFEWTNRKCIFSITPLYTMIIKNGTFGHQAGFRIGLAFSNKDVLFANQNAKKLPALPEISENSISETELWKDLPSRIVVSPKIKSKVHLEIRPEQIQGKIVSIQWMKYEKKEWKKIEGATDSSLEIEPAKTGKYWYCAKITDSEGKEKYSAITQVLVHRLIGTYYKDKATKAEGIVCDINEKGKPSVLLSLEETETSISYEEAQSWCKSLGENWTLANIDQLYSVVLNTEVINNTLQKLNKTEIANNYWTNSVYPANSNYVWQWYDIRRIGLEKTDSQEVFARSILILN